MPSVQLHTFQDWAEATVVGGAWQAVSAVVLVWYSAHVGVSSTIVVTARAPRLLPERLNSAVQLRAATSARSPGVFALSALLRTKRAQPHRWYHLASMPIIQTIVASIEA